MNLYDFLKQDLQSAKQYHLKYDRFLKSLRGLNQPDDRSLGVNDFGKPLTEEELSNPERYLISEIDLEYFQAKGYIKLTKKNLNNYEVTLADKGRIFLTEEKGFITDGEKRLEIMRLKYNDQSYTRQALRISIITTVVATLALLFDKDNLLGKFISDTFSCLFGKS